MANNYSTTKITLITKQGTREFLISSEDDLPQDYLAVFPAPHAESIKQALDSDDDDMRWSMVDALQDPETVLTYLQGGEPKYMAVIAESWCWCSKPRPEEHVAIISHAFIKPDGTIKTACLSGNRLVTEMQNMIAAR